MNTFIRIALMAPLALLPFAASAEETHTVTIAAYVDGEHASANATSADGDTFPMFSYWSAKNLGHDNGTYSIGPSGYNTSEPYEAVTSDMSLGAKYQTRAGLSWNKSDDGALVSGSCRTGKDYTLEGYSVGDSLAEAEADGPSATHWAGTTNLTSDRYVIVWFRHCLDVPTHVSPKNGAKRTTAAQQLIDWSDVASPYGDVHYIYQAAYDRAINADGSFQNPVYTSGPLNDSEIPTPNTPPARYYWHVQAIDSADNVSWWSNPWKLHVIADPVAS